MFLVARELDSKGGKKKKVRSMTEKHSAVMKGIYAKRDALAAEIVEEEDED
jgi:hypothetical protein